MFRDFDLSLTYTILKVSFDKWVCLFRNWGSALPLAGAAPRRLEPWGWSPHDTRPRISP